MASPNKTITKIFENIDPTQVITEMTNAYYNYHTIREQEQTKRRQIEAHEKIVLAEIAARRELFMEYLSRSFDERAKNFSSMFERIDIAIERGDTQALMVLTNAVVALAQSSPFKDLATIEATRKKLSDSNYEWEI